MRDPTGGTFPMSVSFVLHTRSPLLCNLLGAHLFCLGQAWGEGKGVLAACRRCADSGQELDCNLVMISIGRTRVLNKPKKKTSTSSNCLSG